MKKKIVTIFAILLLSVPTFSNDRSTDIIAGVLNGGIAVWGYNEAYKHKEVKIYVNVTATIFAIRSLVYFVKAAK